jgi:hypothetical protein
MLLSKPQEMVDVNWNRLAYAQVVKTHEEVCSAVMLFGDLYRTKSPAHRVLLFPKHWATDKSESAEGEDAAIFTTRRLLRKAARKFRVVLVPMGTTKPELDGRRTNGRYD